MPSEAPALDARPSGPPANGSLRLSRAVAEGASSFNGETLKEAELSF